MKNDFDIESVPMTIIKFSGKKDYYQIHFFHVQIVEKV